MSDLDERVERWLNSFVERYNFDDFATVYGKDADETLLRDLIADWKRLNVENADQAPTCQKCGNTAKRAWMMYHTPECSIGRPAPFTIGDGAD